MMLMYFYDGKVRQYFRNNQIKTPLSDYFYEIHTIFVLSYRPKMLYLQKILLL